MNKASVVFFNGAVGSKIGINIKAVMENTE
jgi:hypothetical protein